MVGFPGGVFTRLLDGRIHPQIRAGTTVGDARWASLFASAGIHTVAMSRTRMLRELDELGTAEPRMRVDMMSAAAPDLAGPLRAIRP